MAHEWFGRGMAADERGDIQAADAAYRVWRLLIGLPARRHERWRGLMIRKAARHDG